MKTTRWFVPNPENDRDETERAEQLLAETRYIEERQSMWY